MFGPQVDVETADGQTALHVAANTINKSFETMAEATAAMSMAGPNGPCFPFSSTMQALIDAGANVAGIVHHCAPVA